MTEYEYKCGESDWETSWGSTPEELVNTHFYIGAHKGAITIRRKHKHHFECECGEERS